MRRVIISGICALAAAGALAGPASAATTTTCTGTLTGTYDRVVVPDGATCTLDGATVLGNLTAGTGSSLYTMNATIGGNVMSRDAATVRLIDTNVGRNIKVTGTTGLTRIGDRACRVDPTVGLNVMANSNLGNVAICSLSIGRNLSVKDNAGRVGVFQNTVGNNALVFRNTGLATRVRHNTVTINLNCRGNVNKVISVGNTAAHTMGQCQA